MAIEDIVSTSENSILFNVFQTPFLSPDECTSLAEEVLAHQQSHPHFNSMQKYTVDVTSLFKEFLSNTLTKLTPTINDLFYFGNSNRYSLYSAYAILYSATQEGERELKTHVDDSDITVNITLKTENLKGSEIGFLESPDYGNTYCIQHFGKLRDKLRKQSHFNTVVPQVGCCLIHRGDHPHRTFPIQEGKRITLILWLKKI